MKKNNDVLFKEQVFYHNGDYSSFLDGAFISTTGITVQKQSRIPPELTGAKLKIEFCLPKSDKVLKAIILIQDLKTHLFLNFTEIDHESLITIASYIDSRVIPKKLSIQL